MGIVRELSPELDPVEFPDTMSPEQVEAYVAEKGDELRRRLIARKQASLATETEGEEALKYAMGEMSAWEQGGSILRSLPQETTRFAGGLLEGLGAYLAEAPIPRERGEVGTGVVQENLRRQQRTRQQVAEEIEQSPLRAVGREVKEAAPEIFPTLPGVRDSLPSQVMGGLGSIVGLAPAMVAGPAAPFVGGAMYGLSAGEDFADDARRVVNDRIAEALANGDYDTAADLERRKFDMEDKARQAGRVIGAATEGVLGVAAKLRVGKSSIGGIGERLAERLVAKSAPQAVQRAVRGAVEGGATEAAQEATEQALGNAAALAVYDPDRSIMDDLGQAALVGGLTGGVAGGARGSDRRNPLPRSTAAAAGKRVAQEIPQDVGDIAAPDITEADVEDVFAGVPAAPVEQPPQASTPLSSKPSTRMPLRAETIVPPRPTREGRSTEKRDQWDESYGSMRRGGRTHNDDGTPYQPTAFDEVMQEVTRELSIDPEASIQIAGIGGSGALGLRIRDMMDAGWVWDPNQKRMVNPSNPSQTVFQFGQSTSPVSEPATEPQPAPVETPVADAPVEEPAAVAPVEPPAPAPTATPATTDEELVKRAAELVRSKNKASVSMLQRSLKLGYSRAVRVMDELEKQGVVGPSIGAEPRAVIPETKPSPNAIEAAITATPAPEPATPPQAEAPRVTIPPDDAASATRAAEADIPLGVKRPAVADPKLESLSDAEFKKVRRTADANIESLEKRYDAEDPTLSRSELAAAQDAFTAVELEAFRRTKKGLYAPDLFYELVKLADRARDPNSEAAAQARILIEEIQRQGMSLDRLVSELSASSPDEAEVLRGQAEDLKSVLGQQKPAGIESQAIDVESRQVEGQPAPVTGAPEEGIAASAEVDAEMTRATARQPQTPAAPVTAPEAGIAERVAADTEMERATAQAGQTPAEAALNAAPEEGVVGVPSKKPAKGRKAKPITPAPAAEPAPAQAAEVSTPEVVKQTKPPMAPKAQKAFLLEKIDEAIATAPDADGFESVVTEKGWSGKQVMEAQAKAIAANKAKYGTVTIEVPGDGTFEILNNKTSLKTFKEKAKKFPTGKVGPSDASLPAKNQSRPATVGKSDKASFIESSKAFVSDGDKVVPTTRFIFSDKTKSVATDGKKLLVWDSPIGPEGFYTTEGKKTDESGRFLDYKAIISAPMNKVFKGLNTERLFNLVKQAMATVPDKRNAGTARSPKWVEQPRIVQIYRNADGSIGVLAEGIDEAAYVHNVRKGSKLLTKLNGEQFLEIIQASRRMGSDKVDISFSSEDPQLGIVGVTWPDGGAYVMPMRGGLDSTLAESLTTGEKQPDIIQRALDAAIKATDPKSATFSDPFLIAAVGLPVLNAALRLARRVYLRTRNLVRAKQQGMRLIRRRQRTIPAADMPKIEEAFGNLVDNGITEGPPPQTVTPASPLPGGPRRASRGLFKGDVTIDSDAQWQAQADEWIAQFNGNIRRAFEAARSTDFQTTGLNQSAQYYVFGKLLELSEIAANAARNDVDMLRYINLQKEITEALKFDAAEAGKTLAAANLVQNRLQWMFPVLTYRNLIREAQKRLPFPDVVADEVRTWLSESGRRAVQEMRNAMTDADKVFARELKSTVRDMRVVWRDVMTASVESQENMRRKILEELVKAPELKGLSRQGYIDIANLLGKAWEKERARIFQAEFRKQVPLPSVKEDDRRKLFTAIPNILKWANLGLLDNEAFRNAIAPQYGVAKFDGETAKKLNTMAQEAQKVGGANRKRIINEMNLFMQEAGGVRTLDVIRDYWFAAVLSGIRTHIEAGVNVLNGALMAAMGASMAKPGSRGTVAKAFGKGLSEALDDFWPILWNGEVWRNVNYNPDAKGAVTLETLSKSRNLFAKAIGQLKYVSRLTTALDHLTGLSTRQAMMAWALSRRYPVEHLHRYMTPSDTVLKQARARAEAEGTSKDAMNKRVREIVEEWVPVEILISAKDLAEVATYTNRPRGLAGAAYDGLQAFEKKFPGAKFLSGTMFARFGGNAVNTMLNYTAPAALWRYYQSAPSRQNAPTGIRLGEEERLLLLAQMALGSTLGAFAAALFLGDDDEEKDRFIDITGSFRSLEPGKKNQLLSEGRVPYSIRVGNKYYSYRQMGFGGVLGAVGELRDRQLFNREKWDQESMVRKVMDAGAAGLFIVRDSPAISSFTEFLGFANAYKYDPDEIIERSAPKFLARLAGSAIPNLVKEIDAWGDPSIFKANVGHEYFVQQVPYLRRELGAGPMLNVLGEPVQVERFPWSRWIKTRREDKAWSTLGTLASRGVFLPVPSANVKVLENGKRRPMTPQEQHAYQKRVGADYRKFVEENSEKLLRMKPDEAVKFIGKQTERIRRRND